MTALVQSAIHAFFLSALLLGGVMKLQPAAFRGVAVPSKPAAGITHHTPAPASTADEVAVGTCSCDDVIKTCPEPAPVAPTVVVEEKCTDNQLREIVGATFKTLYNENPILVELVINQKTHYIPLSSLDEYYILATAYEFCVANQKALSLSKAALKPGCAIPVANKIYNEIKSGNGVPYNDVPESFFAPASPTANSPVAQAAATAAANKPVVAAATTANNDPVVKPARPVVAAATPVVAAASATVDVTPVVTSAAPVVAPANPAITPAAPVVAAAPVTPATPPAKQQEPQEDGIPVFPPGKNIITVPGSPVVKINIPLEDGRDYPIAFDVTQTSLMEVSRQFCAYYKESFGISTDDEFAGCVGTIIEFIKTELVNEGFRAVDDTPAPAATSEAAAAETATEGNVTPSEVVTPSETIAAEVEATPVVTDIAAAVEEAFAAIEEAAESAVEAVVKTISEAVHGDVAPHVETEAVVTPTETETATETHVTEPVEVVPAAAVEEVATPAPVEEVAVVEEAAPVETVTATEEAHVTQEPEPVAVEAVTAETATEAEPEPESVPVATEEVHVDATPVPAEPVEPVNPHAVHGTIQIGRTSLDYVYDHSRSPRENAAAYCQKNWDTVLSPALTENGYIDWNTDNCAVFLEYEAGRTFTKNE